MLGIIGSTGAVAGWIAFGPGERQFSMSLQSSSAGVHGAGGSLAGRIAFGVARC